MARRDLDSRLCDRPKTCFRDRQVREPPVTKLSVGTVYRYRHGRPGCRLSHFCSQVSDFDAGDSSRRCCECQCRVLEAVRDRIGDDRTADHFNLVIQRQQRTMSRPTWSWRARLRACVSSAKDQAMPSFVRLKVPPRHWTTTYARPCFPPPAWGSAPRTCAADGAPILAYGILG